MGGGDANVEMGSTRWMEREWACVEPDMSSIRPSLRAAIGALALTGVLTGTVVAVGAAARTEAQVAAPRDEKPISVQPNGTTVVPPDTTVVPPDAVVTTATSAAAATPATARPRRAAPTRQVAKNPASGQQAVAAFTAAVDGGDAAAAWRLLSARSQAYRGTQSRFAASFDKLAQGGYGGWSADRGRTARSVVINSSGEGEVLVVTLSGSTSRQGQTVLRAQAFPVRHLKGTFRLELWALGNGGTVPELTAPGPVLDATVGTAERRPTFQATARGAALAWALDDRDATFTSVRGGIARHQPGQALAVGTHVLTVASEGPGWLTAIAVIVEIR